MLFKFGGKGGTFGAVFFFVLSGFLITFLLFEEYKRNDKINIYGFYVRRVLRIWPLYFLTVLLGFVVYPFALNIAGYSVSESANAWTYLLFGANFDHIYNAFPTNGMLGVQWSVCVEEQFYLLWPLFMFFFVKSKYFPYLALAIVIISHLLHQVFFADIEGGIYHLVSCFRYLALGACLAWLAFHKPKWLMEQLVRIPKVAMAAIYIGGLGLMFLYHPLAKNVPFFEQCAELIYALFFTVVILEQCYSSRSILKLGKSKILTWLGKISYGLYLLHMVAIYAVMHLLPTDVIWIPIKIVSAVGLSIAISYLSYTFFESYFLKLKERFSS